MTPAPGLVAAEWASAIAGGLESAGVQDVVFSPGSRSTPLVLAARASGLRRHVELDERSAAFFALGLARESRRPVALICTSGSAGGHYLPAIMEASHAGIPLVAVTADRPFHLMDSDANQTTDQTRLYGNFVRRFADLGDPQREHLDAVHDRVFLTVLEGLGPVPGPVHINARFAKPLEPESAPKKPEPRSIHSPVPHYRPTDASTLARIDEQIASAERGLIVAGASGPEARGLRAMVAQLSERCAFPMMADACSQLRYGCSAALTADGLGWLPEHDQVDLVIQIGGASMRPLPEGATRIAFCERGWNDPSGHGGISVRGPMDVNLRALLERIAPSPARAWLDHVEAENDRVWATLDQLLAEETEPMAEPNVLRSVLASMPSTFLLQLGNSLPIRTVDRFCRASADALDVSSQRGLSGIDGSIAQAAGAATAGRDVVAVLGDVTFAHDLASLRLASRTRGKIALVVIDNGGGRIFESLPVFGHLEGSEYFEEAYLTHPRLDLAAIASAFGLSFAEVRSTMELESAVGSACTTSGCTLIRAVVGPSSYAEIARQVESTLARADS